MSMGIIAGVATLAGGVYSYKKQREASEVTRDNSIFDAALARRDAQAQESEDREQLRRMRMKGRRMKSQQRAKIASSGVTFSGSPLDAMAETAGAIELDEQDFARVSRSNLARGESRARSILNGGRGESSAIKSRATAGLIGTVGQGFSQFGKLGLGGANK